MVTMSNLLSGDRGFDFRQLYLHQVTLGKMLTHTRASVTSNVIRYRLNDNGDQRLEWRKIKAAYCWVYDKCHLWPDCIARFPLSCLQKNSGPFQDPQFIFQ